MIYYDIQHHGNIENIKWLAKLLDDGENYLNFSLDMGCDKVRDISAWMEGNSVNGRVLKSYPITWCGPSQITQIRQSMHEALAIDGWEYFVNLSGVCFPTKPQVEIKAFLKRQYKAGIHSFAYSFVPKKPAYWICCKSSSVDFNYKKRKYLRLWLECTEEVLDAFGEGFDPVSNVMHRRAVHCLEVPHHKKIYLRGLLPWELKDRMSFWDDKEYVIGRTWSLLHRKQVEWLVESYLSMELYWHCLNMFEPDETYLPSLLRSPHNPYKFGLENNNLRYLMGSPGVVNKNNLAEVMDSPCFFARKLPSYHERKSIEKDVELYLKGSL